MRRKKLDTRSIRELVGSDTSRLSDLRKRLVIESKRIRRDFYEYLYVRHLTPEELAENKRAKRDARKTALERALPIDRFDQLPDGPCEIARVQGSFLLPA